MAEESGMFSSGEQAGADQTEIRQTAAEQPGSANLPADSSATPTIADQPTGAMPPIQAAPAQATLPAAPSGAQPGYPLTEAYPSYYAQPGYSQSMYQQAPNALPLQPGQPGLTAPPRKRRTWLWTALIIVVAFLLSGGVALAVVATLGPTNTPTQALQQYCDGYLTTNAQEVYNALSKASQEKNSLADIQQSVDQLKNLSGLAKMTDCKVSNVQQNGSNATGTITITEKISFGNLSVSVPLSMGLVLENNTWKIDIFQMHSNFFLPTPTVSPDFSTPAPSQQ